MNIRCLLSPAAILSLVLACAGLLSISFLRPHAAKAMQGISRSTESQVPDQSVDGMVTCSVCGAKHIPALNQPASVCARKCVHAGASFELISPDSTYLLKGSEELLKGLAGQRARITGKLQGQTIRVTSVAMIPG